MDHKPSGSKRDKRMRRIGSLLAAMALLGTMMFAVAAPVGAVGTYAQCSTKSATFKYNDWLNDKYFYVYMTATGCYNGSSSWPSSMKISWSSNAAVIGQHAKYLVDMSTPTTGTYFQAYPVFKSSMGFDLLVTPQMVMTATGVWSRSDVYNKACSEAGWAFYPVAGAGLYTYPVTSASIGGKCSGPVKEFDPVYISSSWS